MTQHELARAAGMTQPNIARIECGRVIPRTSTLIAILETTHHALVVEPSGPPVDREPIRRRLALDVPQRTWQALGGATAKDRNSPTRILRRLRRFGVPFVLLGELAEAARGAPSKVGRVIEVCPAQTDVARDRIASALEDLGASTKDGSNFTTRAGRLRLLIETAAGDDYDILTRNADWMFVDTGLRVPIAALDDLIRIRRAANTPDDRAAVTVLRAIGEQVR